MGGIKDMNILKKYLIIGILGMLLLMSISSATPLLEHEKTAENKIQVENNIYYNDMLDFNNPPVMDYIDGPTKLKVGELGKWLLHAWDNDSAFLQFFIDLGDGTNWVSGWISCVGGAFYDFTHIYPIEGTYIITVFAEDTEGARSESISLTLIVPRSRDINYSIINYLQNYPHLLLIIRLISELH